QTRFSESLVTIKIVPASPVKPALAADFIKSLHHSTCALAFELIDNGQAAHIQLTVAQADRALIERQAEIYLPDCALIENPDSLSDLTLSYIFARPETTYTTVRKLSDFAL